MNGVNRNNHPRNGLRLLSNAHMENQLVAANFCKAGSVREPFPRKRPVTVYLCSEHPLVRGAMASALKSESNTTFTAQPVAKPPDYFDSFKAPGIAIVDTDSVRNLEELLLKAVTLSIRPIAVVASGMLEPSEQLRLVGWGVWGIVLVSRHFSHELPKALQAVAGGNFWMNPSILQDFVKQRNALLSRLPEPHLLTTREEQVVNFLARNLSNKQIAAFLGISERTVKFHVSNILQKTKFETRRDLIQLSSEAQQVCMAGG